jgi:predicted acetyltransferase
MDEMKVKLSTRFMRSIVSKLIAKAIYKKFGYKVNVQLNELDVSVIDGEANIKTNVEVKIDNKEFMKIIKEVGLD